MRGIFRYCCIVCVIKMHTLSEICCNNNLQRLYKELRRAIRPNMKACYVVQQLSSERVVSLDPETRPYRRQFRTLHININCDKVNAIYQILWFYFTV